MSILHNTHAPTHHRRSNSRVHAVALALITAFAGLLSLTTTPAGAQQQTQPLSLDGSLSESLQLHMVTGLYIPRLRGSSELGPMPLSSSIRLERELHLDDLEPTFNAEITLRKRSADGTVWGVQFSGLSFSTDSRKRLPLQHGNRIAFGDLILEGGDLVDASFDMTTIAGELIFPPFVLAPRPDDPNQSVADPWTASCTQFLFSPKVGIRLVDVEQRVELVGVGVEQVDATWAAPYVGANVDINWLCQDVLPAVESVSLRANGTIGPALGGDGGMMWQVGAGIHLFFTQQFGVMVGYRLIEVRAEDDDYQLDGGVQGLFFGGTLRF